MFRWECTKCNAHMLYTKLTPLPSRAMVVNKESKKCPGCLRTFSWSLCPEPTCFLFFSEKQSAPMSHALQFKYPDHSENFLYLWVQDHWIINCLCSLNQICLIITFCSSPAEGHQVEISVISAPSGCAFMAGYPINSLPPECHHLHPPISSCTFLCLCFHWHVAMWQGSGPGQEIKSLIFYC